MPNVDIQDPFTDKWVKGFTADEACELNKAPEEPVASFPLKFRWRLGPWFDIFDLQIELITQDIQRAKAEDKLVVYLSCPVSSRGGGYSGTNVDVAKHVERFLLQRWGEAFWILNPAQYQLESKAGTGLIDRHARRLGIRELKQLTEACMPTGGDYMRMWTTVLVRNGVRVAERDVGEKLVDTGQFFDAFYFIGPRDVQSFFMTEGVTLTAGIEAYFARKFATNADFRSAFSVPGIVWPHPAAPATPSATAGTSSTVPGALNSWVQRRKDFLRYYSLRASVNFSLGSHDEWLIFRQINERRRSATQNPERFMVDGDVGEQLAGFFDGGQIDPGSTQCVVSRGYAG